MDVNLVPGDKVEVLNCLYRTNQNGVIEHVGFTPDGPQQKMYDYGVRFKDGRISGFMRNELKLLTAAPDAIAVRLDKPGRKLGDPPDMVNHPDHYGGKDNPYEVVKVLFAWGLWTNAYLWNTVKYIARHARKHNPLEDLRKARWYLDEEIKRREAAEAATKASDQGERA